MQSIHPQQQYPSDPFRDTAEKAGSIRSGHVNPYSNNVHGYGHGYPPPLTPAREALTGPGSDDGSKGIKIKRSIAIGGVVAIFLLFATVIGLAAGLGMTQENLRQARNDLVVAQGRLGSSVATTQGTGGTTNPTTITAPAPTGIQPIPTTISPTPTTLAVQCPAGNDTSYTATTGFTNKQFRRICGIDYGQGEATDISNKKVASLAQCMDLCAANKDCTGAGWGNVSGDKGGLNSCWMKKGLKSPHKATPDWGFGVLVKEGDS